MRYDPRVPIVEFDITEDGKIKLYERRADWLYDHSKQINESKSKLILLASMESVPGNLEITLKEAAHKIAYSGRSEKRWENYLKSSNFVFIRFGELGHYRNSEITDFFVNIPTESGFHQMQFDTPTENKTESGVKIGCYYIVQNPKGIRRVDTETLKERLEDM